MGYLSRGLSGSDFYRMYDAEPHAPSFTTTQIKNLEVMGPKIVDGGVNFTLYLRARDACAPLDLRRP
jgi:hypothetical protein